MLMYALIGLSLVLIGIVGLQFTYLFYMERIYKERQKYLHDLEKRHSRTLEELESSRRRIAEQDDLLDAIYPDLEQADEAWADVIEER
jgi:uncharacterized membrane protein